MQKQENDVALNQYVPDIPYTILLATYNGARFIDDFLESCLWSKSSSLLVRDDGSSDSTIKKIQLFAEKNSINYTILTGKNLGPKNNFAKLLEHLEKPYFFFADQDDIWEKHKIPTMLHVMQKLETQYGENTPLLVYSDASLMHISGEIYNNSFFKSAMLPLKWNEDFRNVLVMPHVPGCTMLGNQALAKASLPIAEEATMHDAWVLQVANALGVVCEIEDSLIRYRQHENNVFGANTLSWRNIILKVMQGKKIRHNNIVQSQQHASALFKHCGYLMSDHNSELCQEWAKAKYKSWFERRVLYAKYGFKKAGLVRNSVLWICG